MSALYLLDTHPFVFWLLERKQLKTKTRKLLEDETVSFRVTTASILEIRYLIDIGRIELDLADALSYLHLTPGWALEPFDERAMHTSLSFTDKRDPFDCMILATAVSKQIPIITRDSWMKKTYKRCLW